MDEKNQMSPLGRLLMGILHRGTFVAAVLLVIFAGIMLFQRRQADGSFVFQNGDFGFLGVLGFMLLMAVYLVRSIKKEMQNPGGKS